MVWVRCCACNFQQKADGAVIIPTSKCPKCGENKIDLTVGSTPPDWYVEHAGQAGDAPNGEKA